MNAPNRRRRRLAATIVLALMAGGLLSAGTASAKTVTLDDIAAAEAEARQAEARLAETRRAIEETEQAVARLQATMLRLGERRSEGIASIDSQDSTIRTRIAAMYMTAGGSTPIVVTDVASFSARLAYLAAIGEGDRDLLNRLVVSTNDLGDLLASAEQRLAEERSRLGPLQEEAAARTAAVETARGRVTELRSTWQAQEEARRAAEEEELRRQEELLASQLTTTTQASTPASTTTTTTPDYGYVPTAGVEQWRPMVTSVFQSWGLAQTKCATRNGTEFCVGSQVDNAMAVMACESNGVPYAVNSRSGTAGLFQNHPYYWQSRVDRVRAYHSDKAPNLPADADILNPEHNAIVAALLVWESRETLLGNRNGGAISPAVWPEFNWEKYANSGYGYSAWGKGPNPWGHWSCARYPGIYSNSWVHPWASQQSPP